MSILNPCLVCKIIVEKTIDSPAKSLRRYCHSVPKGEPGKDISTVTKRKCLSSLAPGCFSVVSSV